MLKWFNMFWDKHFFNKICKIISKVHYWSFLGMDEKGERFVLGSKSLTLETVTVASNNSNNINGTTTKISTQQCRVCLKYLVSWRIISYHIMPCHVLLCDVGILYSHDIVPWLWNSTTTKNDDLYSCKFRQMLFLECQCRWNKMKLNLYL